MKKMKGKVYLVGAGPGDPGLLTVRGKELLQAAQVVIYDALVNPQILQWARPGSLKIYAGKRGSLSGQTDKERRKTEQDLINRLLVDYSLKGRTVIRLKGGDPFLFGRGGEECENLKRHGIAFEVVPGVSSVTAVPAYAGIPVTDRRHTSMLSVITGHSGRDFPGPGVDWKKISPTGTLVILMGLDNIGQIVGRLQIQGWPGKTPAAVISRGTLPNQKVLTGTLSTIRGKVRRLKSPLPSPALIVIGEVVRLADKIRWFRP